MLVFDLPDYSKSSTAQNEKLVPERQGDGGVGGGSGWGGGGIRAISQLSRVLPPSPRASRRFGVALMSPAEETQSGQLLIWQLRGREGGRGGVVGGTRNGL